MTEIETDAIFKYQLLTDSEYMLGTNESDVWGNGLVERNNYKNDTISIPDFFKSKPITETGQYAFTRITSIKYILIGHNVRYVHRFAFADLYNVELVLIPSSVEVLFSSSIYFWNSQKNVSAGKVQIIFDTNSNLSIVGQYMFHSKEIVQIFSPSIITPKCLPNFAMSVKKKILYSPYSFNFCGLTSQSYFSHPYHLGISKFLGLYLVLILQNI